MLIATIIAEIAAEIERLERVRDLLSDPPIHRKVGRSPKSEAISTPTRRAMSDEAKAKIAAAQRKRWAKSRSAVKETASAETAKLPGRHKTGEVTLTRGATRAARALRRLPGKRRPPTLALKRGKNQSREMAITSNENK
jgi:hypothetical protein